MFVYLWLDTFVAIVLSSIVQYAMAITLVMYTFQNKKLYLRICCLCSKILDSSFAKEILVELTHLF